MEVPRLPLSPNASLFPIPSLYSSLPDEDVGTLERAFGLSIGAEYAASDLAYTDLPQHLRVQPAALIGRTISLSAQSRYRDAHRFLEENISLCNDGGGPQTAHILLRALFAIVKIYFLGSFEAARSSVVELSEYLQTRALEALTDLDISCVETHLAILRLAEDGSPGFDVKTALKAYPIVKTSAGISELRDLRNHLYSLKRWREEACVMDTELLLTKATNNKIDILNTFLMATRAIGDSPVLVNHRASKLIALSYCYGEVHLPDEAKKRLEEARSLCSAGSIRPDPNVLLILDILGFLNEASSTETCDLKPILATIDRLAGTVSPRSHVQSLAMISAKHKRQKGWSLGDATGKRINEQIEKILRELGDTHSLFAFGLSHKRHASETKSDVVHITDWWRRFDSLHPGYSIWRHKVERQVNLANYLPAFEERIGSLEARERAMSLLQVCQDFWGVIFIKVDFESGTVPSRRQIIEKTDGGGAYLGDSHKYLNVPDPDSRMLYSGILGRETIGRKQHEFELLLEWCIADLKDAKLSPSELTIITGLPFEGKTNHEVVECLESMRQKTRFLGCLYGTKDAPATFERWHEVFQALRSWLSRTDSFPSLQQTNMLLELQQERLSRLIPSPLSGAWCAPTLLNQECRFGLTLAQQLQGKLSESYLAPFRRICYHLFYVAVRNTWEGENTWTDKMEEDWKLAVMMLMKAADEVHKEGLSRSPAAVALAGLDRRVMAAQYYNLAEIYVAKFESGGSVDLSQTLRFFRGCELLYLDRRVSLHSETQLGSIRKYLGSLEDVTEQAIFPTAVRIQCLKTGADQHANSIWQWVQAAKGRGLPALGNYSTEDRFLTQNFLADKLNARKFDANHLSIPLKHSSTPVIFVDWYTRLYTSGIGGPLKLGPIMLACRAGQLPRLFNYPTELALVFLKLYKENFLSTLERNDFDEEDETRRPSYWLQKFRGLINPIVKTTVPGETLVLSPCGLLHGIPFHAIIVDDIPLIQRNPVVYTTSMRSLVYSAAISQTNPAKPRKFHSGVYAGSPTSSGDLSCADVANHFQTEVNTGLKFQRSSFLRSLEGQSVDLIHYHGHANLHGNASADPLAQTLDFQDGPMTVSDILSQPPRPKGQYSYHATILGCSSGVTVNTASNEPLGLVPALIHNGASSVVSALWPVDDQDAALFASQFYADFPRMAASGICERVHREDASKGADEVDKRGREANTAETKIVDLAQATQRSVLHIMDASSSSSESSSPDLAHLDRNFRRWAGFVLSGYWMLSLPLNRFQKEEDMSSGDIKIQNEKTPGEAKPESEETQANKAQDDKTRENDKKENEEELGKKEESYEKEVEKKKRDEENGGDKGVDQKGGLKRQHIKQNVEANGLAPAVVTTTTESTSLSIRSTP